MSKHFQDFETYLSQHCGVEGFPLHLDWVVQLSLPAIHCSTVETVHAESEDKNLDFFKFEEADYMCWYFTSIVPANDEIHIWCDDPKVRADWENGIHSACQSNTFRCNDAIVLQLDCVAFVNSPGKIHFIPKRGKILQSSQQAYFA